MTITKEMLDKLREEAVRYSGNLERMAAYSAAKIQYEGHAPAEVYSGQPVNVVLDDEMKAAYAFVKENPTQDNIAKYAQLKQLKLQEAGD